MCLTGENVRFSKAKYCQFAQYPKLLWLDTYRREMKTENEALDDRMITGNEIGDLAEMVEEEYEKVAVRLQQADAVLTSDAEPAIEIGEHC